MQLSSHINGVYPWLSLLYMCLGLVLDFDKKNPNPVDFLLKRSPIVFLGHSKLTGCALDTQN